MQLTALWFVSVRFCYEIQGLGALSLPSAMHSFGPDLHNPKMCAHLTGVAALGGSGLKTEGLYAQVTLQLGIAKSEVAVKKNTHLLLFTLCVH